MLQLETAPYVFDQDLHTEPVLNDRVVDTVSALDQEDFRRSGLEGDTSMYIALEQRRLVLAIESMLRGDGFSDEAARSEWLAERELQDAENERRKAEFSWYVHRLPADGGGGFVVEVTRVPTRGYRIIREYIRGMFDAPSA
jgi:hypothetical protein